MSISRTDPFAEGFRLGRQVERAATPTLTEQYAAGYLDGLQRRQAAQTVPYPPRLRLVRQ